MTDETKTDSGEEMERVSFRLTGKAMERVRALAKKRGMTITEFVRRAIGTEAFIHDEVYNKGARILVESPNERTREIVFHR